MSTVRAIRWPVLALIGGIVFALAIKHYLFGTKGYKVTATFDNVSGLVPKSAVRVAGADAGTVTRIKVTRGDKAQVTMALGHGAKAVGPGASAFVRSVNLLGEKYVDLTPGDLKHPLPSGSSIPVNRTGHTVDLDQVLDVLDPDTRARLSVLINESGIALAGRGTDFNALLRQLPPSLDQARQLVGGLGADNRKLAALIEQGDRVLAPIGNRTPDLQKLITNAASTLHEVSDKRQQLGSTLREAPSTLRQARSTLDKLQDAAGQLKPAAQSLRQTAPALNDTLTTLPAFTKDAVPGLQSITANAPQLQKLATGSLPTVRRLRPTAERLSTFSTKVAPFTQALDQGKVFRDLLNFFWGWARTTRDADGLGHIFGLRIVLDSDLVRSLTNRLQAENKQSARHGKSAAKTALPDTQQPASSSSSSSQGSDEAPKHSLVPDHISLPGLPSVKIPQIHLPPATSGGQGDGDDDDTVKHALDFLLGK